MKTLETQYRTQLEAEILKMLIQRPDMLLSTKLQKTDFNYGVHSKIYDRMTDLTLNGKDFSLINFMDIEVSISEVSRLFTVDDRFVHSPADLKAAVKELKEDVLRNQINRLTKESGNSLEFMEHMESMNRLNTIYTLDNFKEQLAKYENEYEEIRRKNEAGESVGILTGYHRFNKEVSLSRCDLCILGARTSIGKTTFALNVAIEAAAFGQKVLFISMEMPRKQIFDKICARLMKQPISHFKYGKADLEETKRELSAISDNFYFIFAPECKTQDVQSIASLMPGVDLIVVDYLQLLKDAKDKNENENLRLGRISGALKMIAGRMNCTIIAPAQLNRESEKQDREPRLSDLRDSGCIEQDADQVLFLHRADRESTLAKIIVAKNRHGSLGEIQFNFNPSWGWFEEDNDQPNALPTKTKNTSAKPRPTSIF